MNVECLGVQLNGGNDTRWTVEEKKYTSLHIELKFIL